MEMKRRLFRRCYRPTAQAIFVVAFWAAVSTSALAQPKITVQPTSRIAPASSTYTLRVAASGTAPLSYQWYFNAAPLGNATNAILTLTNLQRSLAGQYFVAVSDVTGT